MRDYILTKLMFFASIGIMDDKNKNIAIDTMSALPEDQRGEYAVNLATLVTLKSTELVAPLLSDEHIATLEEMGKQAEEAGKSPQEIGEEINAFLHKTVPNYAELLEEAATQVTTEIQTRVAGLDQPQV